MSAEQAFQVDSQTPPRPHAPTAASGRVEDSGGALLCTLTRLAPSSCLSFNEEGAPVEAA